MTLRRRLLQVTGAALAVGLLAAGCGGTRTSSLTTAAGAVSAAPQAQDAPVVIRLSLAPDPVWQWLEDSGTRAAWERTRNVRVEVSSAFDQFSAFVGGHADMVVINALDVPRFVEQPERDPVIIGKYTVDRSVLAVPRTSRAETLEEIVERRIAVESSLGSTLLWGLIADLRYDLEFGPDGADFDVVVVDSASVADLVIRGDVDACICNPASGAAHFADGRLRTLYGGKSAAQIYSETIFGGAEFGGERSTFAAVFVVDAGWHAANPQAVEALLDLWQQGLDGWRQNRAQIVADYPHLFSVETSEEIDWLVDHLEDHDWIVPSVYITEQEAETHTFAFEQLKDRGLVGAEAAYPEINLTYSPGVRASGTGSEG